jgi:hypothetical protein
MANTFTFNVQIIGLDQLTAAFKKAPQVVEPILQDAIVESAAALSDHTNQSTVPFRTGTLIRSFKPPMISRLQAVWSPKNVNYAAAVEFGAPPSPGRYVPAIGRRLVNPSHPSFGMWPGFQGRHYMEQIRSASQDQINQVFRTALQKIKEAL